MFEKPTYPAGPEARGRQFRDVCAGHSLWRPTSNDLRWMCLRTWQFRPNIDSGSVVAFMTATALKGPIRTR